MRDRQVRQAVLAVRTPGASVKMNDGWTRSVEFLEADTPPAIIAQAEGWSQ
jgi:hypothetical protein